MIQSKRKLWCLVYMSLAFFALLAMEPQVSGEIVVVHVGPYVPEDSLPVDVRVGDKIRFESQHPPLVPCVWGASDMWQVYIAAGPLGDDYWQSASLPTSVVTTTSPSVVQWSEPVSFIVSYAEPGTEFCPYYTGCLRVFDPSGQCCEGVRGDIMMSCESEGIDITDLTSLVSYMFKSGESPLCPVEADVDGNSRIDIADLTHFVTYMFKDGPQPAMCP